MSMDIVTGLPELRAWINAARARGEQIAFVPTMGNLHRGHFSLIEQACAASTRVVASIFVNPTQFGPNEDFSAYPRTPEQDQAGLEAAGCDLLFLPSVDTLYPFGAEQAVRIEVPGLSEDLCGKFRPGHFAGVATVVARLFNMVRPDIAWFGQKDFQQVRVIERLVADLSFPIRISVGSTVRETNGLAMSSRNGYLTPAERDQAAEIFRALTEAASAVRGGQAWAGAERQASDRLAAAGFRVDYVAVRRAADLSMPGEAEREALVVLAAARLGRARLIDNLLI